MVMIIDPQNAGIAGNMVVGAMIDLGVEKEEVQEVMEYYSSYFGDVKIKISKASKSGMDATYADIQCLDKEPIKYRQLQEKLDSINHDRVTPEMLNFAGKVFKIIAEAESQVHGTSLDQVHFHEVGAADAVADIIGAAYCYHILGMDNQKIYGMPPALGGGRKETDHGYISIPAPATLEILKDIPTIGGPVNQELTTPTGAAIFKAMVQEHITFYPLIINSQIGYGAGKLDLSYPNTLRVIMGESP
ncbi:MAG TPA: LarC family nickel insertion protein, partial [Methanobacterium sp.]|nr:LarC family nickel insertion protein [Methanobacterium sp.]